jgi:hypothetical protein
VRTSGQQYECSNRAIHGGSFGSGPALTTEDSDAASGETAGAVVGSVVGAGPEAGAGVGAGVGSVIEVGVIFFIVFKLCVPRFWCTALVDEYQSAYRTRLGLQSCPAW